MFVHFVWYLVLIVTSVLYSVVSCRVMSYHILLVLTAESVNQSVVFCDLAKRNIDRKSRVVNWVYRKLDGRYLLYVGKPRKEKKLGYVYVVRSAPYHLDRYLGFNYIFCFHLFPFVSVTSAIVSLPVLFLSS